MASGAVVILLLVTNEWSQQTMAERMADNQVAYVFPKQTVARAKPDPSAPIVNTYPPFSFALVKNIAPGWVYVEPLPDAKTQEGGWIEPQAENLSCCHGVLALAIRREDMRDKAWPANVKLEVLRGRVRVGFTSEQVKLAYTTGVSSDDRGNPARKAIEETAAGVVETWTYRDATYTLKSGRVVKINRIE